MTELVKVSAAQDLSIEESCLRETLHVIAVTLNITLDFGESKIMGLKRVKIYIFPHAWK